MSSTSVSDSGEDRIIKSWEVSPFLNIVYDTETGTWQVANAIGGKPLVVSIDFIHQKVHEGRFFSGGHYVASVSNNGTLDILFQTDATHTFHGVAEATCGGNALMQMYEGVTFSAAGTAMTLTNHNRNSSKVIPSGVTHTPTITGLGTQLNGTKLIPGGSGGTSSGGTGDFAREFVLKPSTNYLLRITNISGIAQPMSTTIEGYIPDL